MCDRLLMRQFLSRTNYKGITSDGSRMYHSSFVFCSALSGKDELVE